MIDFSKYLNKESVISRLDAATKENAIEILVDRVFSLEGDRQTISRMNLGNEVIQRENLKSTGIGKSMAFPHARIEGWQGFTLVAAESENGIDFDSIDGQPVKIIFLMISSTEEPYIILQTMAAIIRAVKEMEDSADGNRVTFQEIINKITGHEVKTSKHLTARDIARPIKTHVNLETSLEKVTHIMHFQRESILPVIDQNNKLCGEISCYGIFDYGMPDFFKQLNTISFVKHIDPFEKYFRLHKDLKVKDLLTEGVPPVREDSTIAEIVFEMTVKQRSKLFMVNEAGELTGVIDRFSIVDQILFF
jgi:mannitol/fructose-specific phosphotransferase system IIA component (Ntr-type)